MQLGENARLRTYVAFLMRETFFDFPNKACPLPSCSDLYTPARAKIGLLPGTQRMRLSR